MLHQAALGSVPRSIDNPIASNVSTTTNEDTPVTFNLSAEEYDGDNYGFVIVSQPSNGTVSITSAQATYTPNANFNGADTFTFTALILCMYQQGSPDKHGETILNKKLF